MTAACHRGFATASVALASLAIAGFGLGLLLPWFESRIFRKKRRIGRGSLPRDLNAWRLSNVDESVHNWEIVRPAFEDAGIYVWPLDEDSSYAHPEHVMRCNGFAYVTPVRGEEWARNLQQFNCHNESTRGGTTSGGLHVVLRIAAMGDVGRHHVEILRKLARGTRSLLTDNHVVPLWNEVHYEDLTFIVSPYVGGSLRECYGWWAKNSVGDIVDMILQALEAITFVHSLGIVHRDLCKANYLVQWHPESMITMRVPLCRPRVFLNDFEMAHEFPPEVPHRQRLLTAMPIPDYQRPIPPEMASGKPYDPFKADIWQLAESFSDFRAMVPDIDSILAGMFVSDCSVRFSAIEARDKLEDVLYNIPPAALLLPPLCLNPSPVVAFLPAEDRTHILLAQGCGHIKVEDIH